MADVTCAHCGGPKQRTGQTGPMPRYCSTDCKRNAYDARRRADGRHDAMLAAKRNAYQPTSHDLTCAVCSIGFTAKRNDQRYCSPSCARLGSSRACEQPGCGKPVRAKRLCVTHYNATFHPGSQKLWPSDLEAKRKRDLVRAKRRRAVVRGVEAEAVDRDVVGERDGWRCGICRRKVDRRRPYPDPMSPSLDHVIPLAEHGPHTYANTRIAHLVCNVRRRARGGGEQLALIG